MKTHPRRPSATGGRGLLCLGLVAALLLSVPSRAATVVDLEAAQTALAAGDYGGAFPDYLRAAREGGDPVAQFTVALFFEKGWGRPPDPPEACRWHEKAAAGGVPVAAHSFADCLARGVGRPADLPQAALWYEKAAGLGHHPSLCSLGELYLKGAGVPKDPAKGVDLCRQAAEKGAVTAQLRLGKILLSGEGGNRDEAGALHWLEAGAKGGSAEAQFLLGGMMRDGLGRPPDASSALYWLESAAAQGWVGAYLPTGLLYANAPLDPETGGLRAEHLAKAYLWLSATILATANPKEREQASVLLGKVREIMPDTWAPTLDEKVARHLAEHPAPKNP